MTNDCIIEDERKFMEKVISKLWTFFSNDVIPHQRNDPDDFSSGDQWKAAAATVQQHCYTFLNNSKKNIISVCLF